MTKRKNRGDPVPVINEAGDITAVVNSKKAPKSVAGEVAPAVPPTLPDTGDRRTRHESCETETIVPRASEGETRIYCGHCRGLFPKGAFEVVADDIHAVA